MKIFAKDSEQSHMRFSRGSSSDAELGVGFTLFLVASRKVQLCFILNTSQIDDGRLKYGVLLYLVLYDTRHSKHRASCIALIPSKPGMAAQLNYLRYSSANSVGRVFIM